MNIVIFIIVGILIFGFTVYFVFLPPEKRYGKIFEWLKYAVVEAEKYLGSGTGQVKLRYLYNLFLKRFALLSKFITFNTFSNMVDTALKWMESAICDNEKISNYIKNSDNKESEQNG